MDGSSNARALRTVTVRGVELGAGRPAVIAPITGATVGEVIAQGREFAAHDAVDLVEWRIDAAGIGADAAPVLDCGARLAAVLGDRPLLATLRTRREGGAAAVDDDAYRALLDALTAAGWADLVDVELSRGDELVRSVVGAAHAHRVAVVASSHDVDGTPPAAEIVARLVRMQELGADVVKVAVMPRSPADVLTLLSATWEAVSRRLDRPAITIAMGGDGVVSRLAGEVFGSAATFGRVAAASAPGQLDATALRDILEILHAAR